VGNHFQGTTNPATSVIDIQSNNNVSIGDMFERSDAFSNTHYRVDVNNTTSVGMDNTKQIQLGSYIRQNGVRFVLADNVSSATTILTDTNSSFSIEYVITRAGAVRKGIITVTFNPVANNLNFVDDYVENISTGITLNVIQISTNALLQYNSTSTGTPGTLLYSVSRLF
jgi:hypothetical protein